MSKLPNPNDFKNFTSRRVPVQNSTKTDSVPLEEVARTFNALETLSKQHTKHLLDLFPKWMYDNADQTDLEYFTYMVRFDKQHNSLVVAVIDNQLLNVGIISLKHRLKNSIKWKTMAGTHPNNTVMYRVWKDDSPVIIVEGIRDFLAGVLLGWNIIAVPTASYRGSIQTGSKDIIYFLIEDDKAEPLMMRLANESAKTAKEVYVIPPSADKMDLTDICYRCSSAKEVLYELTKTKKS